VWRFAQTETQGAAHKAAAEEKRDRKARRRLASA
jgi:hypothetical protein